MLPTRQRTRGRLQALGDAIAALGWLLLGFVVGGMVGIAIVDETDPLGAHPDVNIAIVGVCSVGGLIVAAATSTRLRRRR